jgi:hypothetical protein
VDRVERYREALLFALGNLEHYQNYNWETGSADGFADAIEGGLNLYNREAAPGVKEWLDSETRILWSLQDSSYRENAQVYRNEGVVEGWHGDGNFARTIIMYCLWKSQGIQVYPWREDLVAGAVLEGHALYLSMQAEKTWEGRIVFDTPRSSENLHLPMDWPRINQFPEWFVVEAGSNYEILDHHSGEAHIYSGQELAGGIHFRLSAGEVLHLKIRLI